MKPRGGTSVQARRIEPPTSLDFFPTPLWATRALCQFILADGKDGSLAYLSAWDGSCGEGHMARALREYFSPVWASDIHPYGFGEVGDFLQTPLLGGWTPPEVPDWIIMNPPFKISVDFARHALKSARRGVAFLCRLSWLETGPREKLFREFPLTYCCPFMGRLPMVKGRVSRVAKTATAYAWFVWDFQNPGQVGHERILRIPTTARRLLERKGDYD